MNQPRWVVCFALIISIFSFPVFADTVNFPADFEDDESLQDAIEEAGDNGTVKIARGIYSENITISKNISLIGEETAGVILKGGCSSSSGAVLTCDGSGTIIEIEGAEGSIIDVELRNITFTDAATAIKVTEYVDEVKLYNNVFYRDSDDEDNFDAVLIETTEDNADIEIYHNTFFNTSVAVASANNNVEIRNNIFHSNEVSINNISEDEDNDIEPSSVENNGYRAENSDDEAHDLYFNNSATTTDGEANEFEKANPTSSENDLQLARFQLIPGSSYTNVASGSSSIISNNQDFWIIDSDSEDADPDLGAYGGRYADATPPAIQNFKPNQTVDDMGTPDESDDVPTNEFQFSWEIISNSIFDDGGSYEIVSSECDIYENTCDDGDITEIDFDLLPNTTKLTEPDGDGIVQLVQTFNIEVPTYDVGTSLKVKVEPVDQGLKVSWAPSEGNDLEYVAKYIVSLTQDGTTVPITAAGVKTDTPEGGQTQYFFDGDVSGFTQSGLTNGLAYAVTVQPVFQAQLYLGVRGVKQERNSSGDNTSLKSPFYGDFSSVTIGEEVEGAVSEPVTTIAEAPSIFPALEDEGCFIATAAYGSDMTAEVMQLRQFRDNWLMPYATGRAFVSWYYAEGPKAASWLNSNAEWKPVFQAALYPLVAVAWILESPALMLALLFALVAIFIYTLSSRFSRLVNKNA